MAAAYSKGRRLITVMVMSLILLAMTAAPAMAQNTKVNIKTNVHVNVINNDITVNIGDITIIGPLL
jgi:hypothetical protein